MTSRWKKIWADFWGNKSRTFLTILTIMVGTLAVGFNANLGAYMLESMDGDYLSANPSEGQIYMSNFDEDIVKIAREMPGVDAAEGRATIGAQLIRAVGQPVSIQFTGIKDPSTLTVDRLKPKSGESTIPAYTGKQVIFDASAESLGYKIGDKVIIELDNGRRRELIFAGYMHDVAGFPYNLAQQINAYVTPDTLEWLGGSRQFSALAISVSEKQTDAVHVKQVVQAVADRLEKAGQVIYFVNVYQPGHHFAWAITQGIFFVLGTLGYMTVVLSAFLIVNTITAIMTQQTRQIGIMKAVGGGNSQIFLMYVVLVLGFGLVAFLIAIPLAGSLSSTMGAGMAAYLNFNTLPFKMYPAAVVQQAIVALLVPFLAALWPVYNSIRITVREAISDYGIGGSAKPKKSSVSRGALIVPRPMRLSLRNVFRRKLRLALTLFSLVLGGAIFIGVYNMWASFDKVIEDIQGYFLADINMSFQRGYRFEEVANLAESVPGVSSVEGWFEFPGTLQRDDQSSGTQILFVAPPSTSTLIDPIITTGRWLQPGDENAIVIGNHLLQVFPELKVGDWLTIDVMEKETKWQIVGTYTITGNVSPPLLYVNYEYLSQVIGLPGQVYSLRVLTESHDAVSQKRVNDQLLALFKQRGIQVGSTQLGSDFIDGQKATTNILVYFMMVMAVLITIVGGLGLMGTMSINVLERTREIGVMRAVGASNLDIQSIVIVEGLVIGLISWAISILISFPITNVLTFGVGMAVLTAPMPAVYDVMGFVAWLIFTIVLATLASSLPARNASKLTVRDTLAYE